MSDAPSPAEPSPLARRRRWRERALLLAPALAFGSVVLTIWVVVGWYVLEKPRELLTQQRQELATGVRAVALQTEPVLRQAESALRVVDLWLLTRRGDRPLADAMLRQFVDSVRSGSRQVVDIVLVSPTGKVRRLQAGAEEDDASIAGTAAFGEIAGLVREGIALGLPLRLGGRIDDGRLRLPLLMRLSRPLDDYEFVMATIDLQRLHDAQGLFAPMPPYSLVMLRNDGLALARRPEVPGFVGRNLFEQFPAARRDLTGDEGFFVSSGAATDGRPRIGAFVSLPDYGLKLLLSGTEEDVLLPFWRQRSLVLAAAALATLGLVLLARWLGQLQRAARLREATLQATSNAMPLGLFRTDETGRIVYVNDSYLRVHGLRREDIAWGWTTLVHPEQRDMLIQRWKHHMATGEPIDMVRKMKRGDDGRIRWIAVRTAPLFFDGKVAGQAGTVEDVTERGEQEKARKTLTAIFDMTPDFVCQASEQGVVSYLNPAARARLGMAADAPLHETHISDYFSAEQLELYEKFVLPEAMRQGHWRGRVSVQLGQDRVPVDCLIIMHRDLRGRIETISVILRDMSEQVSAQRERERSEAMLLAVAHTARAQFLVGDTEGRVIFFNAAFEQQHRVQLKDWVGRPLAELFGPQDHARRAPLIAAALAGETRRLDLADGNARDGRSFDVQYAPLRVQSGEIEGLIAIEVDVTEARREEARLRLASQTDALTQLLNRAGFEEGAREQLAAVAGQRLALLCLDLDKFKPVNDQHGHPTGDALLKAVALRLRHALRPNDLAARLGGDEFAVLLPQIHEAQAAAAVSAKLLQAISAPYHIGELELEIGVSIGYCVATTGAVSLEQLVEKADASLYEAKRAGRGCFRGSGI
ncbi:diguanylate cyclase (GGDEF)-like protein/PAS domain S-box-containing protein [Pelomonas saccharophila]|uniref:Diguanylate cyclase (GGDEF)-like protein/PAS domain S-box-containing protein n=1 Tax=Roseateles saccharophilus TaxID=304 RepID=A0ABU1YKL9_ROSSA|nr:diguanylate cyclase [Roseateles saccharophilus]MDR7269278.1 diguanylate cyclase (GGDEF)-like protein/PAS domain S-box-containing protein [Roseateles saccharophilus]